MAYILDTEVKFLPGVGPKRAELLQKELNICTFGDLLYHFPFRYVDKTRIYAIREVNEDLPYVLLKGKIVGFREVNAKQKRLIAIFADSTGSIELVWFKGITFIQKNLHAGSFYTIFGKPTSFNGKLNIVHPELEDMTKEEGKITSSIQAVYNSTERLKDMGLGTRAIGRLQSALLGMSLPRVEETLPPYMLEANHLIPLREALLNIHFPQSPELLKKAQDRLKLEELFYVELSILRTRTKRIKACNGFHFSQVGELFNQFYYNHLPFELTGAQKRVIKEIRADTGSGRQMNRLLQGDVGSGKTMVALMCMLIAAGNGFQSCIMAPTEILATQHFKSMTEMLHSMSVNVALLTGSTKKAERRGLLERLAQGDIHILVGTHALIEDAVRFRQLGLVVIDEQHRFGVAQRGKLWEKSENPPHMLVMTATPIPRTLAMTLYGDLDVSVIDELPPGRKPVKTVHFFDNKRDRVFSFMHEQIAAGRQVYVVYPLIRESEKMDYKNLQDGWEMITQVFPAPKYKVCMVHGKLKNDEKEAAMQEFVRGEAHIMVATSVIEVGVNVPNASVMVIESTERFGLAQLHQLRGRVGRGAEQSFCILMSGVKLSADSRHRMEMMCSTNDGFQIAEADLKLRGPGDLEGTMQSGVAFDLHIANLGTDGKILEHARHLAEQVLDEDPLLSGSKNELLLKTLGRLKSSAKDYSVIS
ncbi:MAG: ATP-dependent DNA helicase RecG [Prevotellaceae bacterium]|jgi:ATP-dependent DNA helicase RecG|nr:ATP-dependent DNA helicase RecG [Prevotellaceae bacterium]